MDTAPALTMPPTPNAYKHPRQSQSKLDVAKALKLRVQGNTCEEIGKIFGVTRQAVAQALTKFEPFVAGLESGTLTAYSEERANLFNAAELGLTASLLDPEAIQKASLRDRAVSFGIIYDKGRLERGQSTSNLSVLGKLILAAESRLGGTTLPPVDITPKAAIHDSQPVDSIDGHTPNSGV